MTLEELELPENVKKILLKHKQEEYKNYLNMHRQMVKESYSILKEKILNRENSPLILTSEEKKLTDWLIENHDDPKFWDEEFEGYRQWWNPIMIGYEHNEELYKQAKEHHRLTCKHHWNHWVDKDNNILEMDKPYICELLCDWDATSKSEGNTDLLWYQEQFKKGLIRFAPKTKEVIERCMILMKTSRE